jgi:hypothetical protein
MLLAALAIGLARAGMAQPPQVRAAVTWQATNGNEFWRIYDDGKQNPLLSGVYRSNSVTYSLRPSPFYYRDWVYRTCAVSEQTTRTIHIYYIKEDGDTVRALIWSNVVVFHRVP